MPDDPACQWESTQARTQWVNDQATIVLFLQRTFLPSRGVGGKSTSDSSKMN
jgi:hypothetical protein